MNNTRTLTEIAATLMATILVVGGTLAAASAQSVFPLPNIGTQNYGKGGPGGGGHPGGIGGGGGGGGGDHGKGGGDHGKGGGGNGGSTLQDCQKSFTGVLSQDQINDFEEAALSVFPSPPQKLT